jgi:hypothetical protein
VIKTDALYTFSRVLFFCRLTIGVTTAVLWEEKEVTYPTFQRVAEQPIGAEIMVIRDMPSYSLNQYISHLKLPLLHLMMGLNNFFKGHRLANEQGTTQF